MRSGQSCESCHVSTIYLVYMNRLTFWPNKYAYCKKVWFWFINGVVLDHFYRSIPRSVNIDHVISILTGKLVNGSIPHISLHHVTRFEPITAAHFDQRYNNINYLLSATATFGERSFKQRQPRLPKINKLTKKVGIWRIYITYIYLYLYLCNSYDTTCFSGSFVVKGSFTPTRNGKQIIARYQWELPTHTTQR